jgi:hypothetical protein
MSEASMVTCEDGQERPEDECVCCADGEYRPADDCVLCGDGEYRDVDECVESIHDGDFYPKSDCVQCYDGSWCLSLETVHLTCGDYAWTDDEEVCYCEDGEYRFRDHCTYVDNVGWYPEDECFICESCNEATHNDDAFTEPNGNGSLCEYCHDNHTSRCEGCDETFYNDDLNADCYCESCADEEYEGESPARPRPEPRLILDYSDRAANFLPRESHDRVLYGVELEVESRDGLPLSGATWARTHLSDQYCVFKSDGSLGPGGFEIVTRPDSLAVHRRDWGAFFANNPAKTLASWSTGRCGMHVHISKSGLSSLQLGKMLCFLNEPMNERMIVKIAGRRSERWCQIAKKKISDCQHPQDRYVALNITRHTAEVRIFKGTLNMAGFFKNIEFCEALVKFTAPAGRSIAEATNYGAFCRWLSYKDYPNLYAFLVDKGFVFDQRPRKRSA